MKDVSADILRIIDANINRTGEGLRVIEEFARLSLDNTSLTQQLKDLRHKILHNSLELQKQLLNARDAAADVGSEMNVTGESSSKGASEIIIANCRRVQESLRVLEELAKTPGTGLDPEAFRQGRFSLYSLEKELLGYYTRKNITVKINGLYVIIDTEWLNGQKAVDIAAKVIKAGAKTIQLRCKNGNTRDFLSMAQDLEEICSEADVPFIINDDLEVALACKADGLHIGQEDLPAAIARKLIPIGMALGVSVRTLSEAKKAVADGADYLGVGAVFATKTKDSTALGLEKLKSIVKSVDIPVVAIGGIDLENIKSVMKTGACSAAVISAVSGADDPGKAARDLIKAIGGQKHE
jgi:thiamine-phosphate pyrophosphorylase